MTYAIRTVTPESLPAFHAGLRHLSDHLGDTHRAEESALANALFGPAPFALGLMAGQGAGVLLALPAFSTIHGGPGLYVSDLWIAGAARGAGLGRRLLAAALRETIWGTPRFLKLTVYEGNPAARAAYDRLGFAPAQGETGMLLEGRAMDKLKDTT